MLTKQDFVARPDIGSAGQGCRLLTNHYRLSKIPEVVIYQYAIEIIIENLAAGRKISARIAREIATSDEVQERLGAGKDSFVFDGPPHLSPPG
jgi:hypothetical protein